MNEAAMATMTSSEKDDWQTPTEVLDVVRVMAPIGLDPCTTPDNPVGARRFYTPVDDGLRLAWGPDGLVFVNPPYGRQIRAWVEKCVREAEHGVEIVALLPARTDTAWWRIACRADALCFWTGRLAFVGADHPAPFPSVLAYWGDRRKRFVALFGLHGWCP